ncbi:MAG: hypothetical protein J6B28_04675 [Eubacterium sp.]|nr:hypothetical protein [Eubacterium sp.]
MCNSQEHLEMQRNVQEKGVIQYERERQEALMREMPNLQTGRVMTYHQHVLTPVKSEMIEAELQKGLPLFTSKAKKKAWRAQMTTLLAGSKAREKFFEPTERATKEATKRVNALRELEKESSVPVLAYVDVMKETTKEASESLNGIYSGSNQAIRDMSTLLDELCQLKSGNNLTQEAMVGLVERYLSMKAALGQEDAANADLLREASMNPSNYSACYVFLFHNLATMLSKSLNEVPMDQVNVDVFAKLQGWIVTSGTTASALKICDDYQAQKRLHQQEVEKEEAKKAQRKRAMNEMTVFLREYLLSSLPAMGIQMEDETMIDRVIDQLVTTSSYDWDDVIKAKTETRFRQNQENLKRALNDRPEIILQRQKDELFRYIVKSELINVLRPMDDSILATLVEKAMNAHADELEKYRKRREFLIADKGLSRFQNLLEMEEVKQLLEADATENEFKERVRQLSERADYNLGQAELLLNERITPVNFERVFRELMKPENCGITFLQGTRQEIMAKVGYYLREDILEQILPGIVENEKKVRDALKAAKVSPSWRKICCRNVSATDTFDEMKYKMRNARVDEQTKENALNLRSGTRAYPLEAWKQLLEWQKQHMHLEIKEFCEELDAELEKMTRTYINEQPGYLMYIELRGYLENEKQTQPIEQEKAHDYKESIRGELLCKWEGFGGLLDGYEDCIMQALEINLKKRNMKHAFLKKVKNNDDLNNLTYEELQMLVNRLRVNIGKCVQEWHGLSGADVERVREKLLPEMLAGTLDAENIYDRAHEISMELINQETAREMRFHYQIGAPQLPKEGNVQYQHVDDTNSTAMFSKLSRTQRRIERFDTARKAWKMLEAHGLTLRVVTEAVRLDETEKENDRAEKLHKFLLGELKKRNDDEANKLYEELNKTGYKEYIQEFRIAGTEEFLFAKETHPEDYRKLTSAERTEYDPVLIEQGNWVMKRTEQLLQLLEKYKLNTRAIARYRAKMRPLLAGLQMGDSEQIYEENKKNFGVKNWEEALDGLEKYFLDLTDDSQVTEEEDFFVEATIRVIADRQKNLNTYKGNVLEPILPLLYKDEAFWTALVADEQVAFAKRVDALYEKLELPLLILQKRYSYGTEFKKQLVSALGKEILYGEERSRSEWVQLFDEYFDRFCRHEIKGVSIKQRHEKLIKENPKQASYFTEILLGHREGLQLMLDEKRLQGILKYCAVNIENNEALLRTFLAGKTELSEGDRVGFEMYLRAEIPYTEKEEFQNCLNDRYRKFLQLKQETLQQTEQSVAVMSERERMLRDVAEHKHAGIEEDGEENLKLEKIREEMRAAGSPLLAALGVKKAPSARMVKNAKKTLEEYGKLPKNVADCLFERILSGAKKEVLDADVQWLQNANSYIERFKLEDLTQTSHINAELLMFLFINYRGQEITSDLAWEGYLKLGERHAMVNGLMDRNMSLALKYRPTSWNILPGVQELQSNTSTFVLKENSLFAAEHRAVMEAMAVGIYTMKEDAFASLVSKKKTYFETAAEVDKIFAEVIDAYTESAEEKKAVYIGLHEYFHADIVKGREYLDAEALRTKAEEILKDENYRRALLSGGEMEHSSYDDLSEQETTLHTTENRKTLERFLAKPENLEFREAYQRLDVEQRKVFALAVLQGDQSDVLPSAYYVCDKDLMEGRRQVTEMQLEMYAAHEHFQPQIAYERVMDILRQANGQMNKIAFKNAMKLTESYIQKHQEKIARDWSLLADGEHSIESVNRIFEVSHPERRKSLPEEVSTLDLLKSQIQAQDTESEEAQVQKERLEQLDAYGLQLLAEVLQDRTMLDVSTRFRKKDEAAQFANADKRERFKEFLQAGNPGERLYTIDLTNALTTLMSFQMRDDVELHHQLSEADFAPEALKRKTNIDWTLLKHAIDFVQEILHKPAGNRETPQ